MKLTTKTQTDDTDLYKSYDKEQMDLLVSMNPAPKVISFKDFVKYIYEPSMKYRQMLKRRLDSEVDQSSQ
jgi:hypothetical protein